LCASCCTNIVEKTSPRLPPVCPFCREHFTSDSAFNNFNSDLLQRKTAHLFNSSAKSKTRIDVRRLKDKVTKVAAKKCSVQEVASLYKELEEYLVNDKEDMVRPLSSLLSPFFSYRTRVVFPLSELFLLRVISL
jgi:hypothetical protein